MKSPLLLIPLFFLSLLLWLVFLPFFYSLSQPEAFFALADGNYSFFFGRAIENALDFMPLAAVLSLSAVFLFLASYKVKKAPAFFVFLALFLLIFAALEPASARLSSALRRDKAEEAQVASSERTRGAGSILQASPSLKAVALEGAGRVVITAETSGGEGLGLRVYGGEQVASFILPAFNTETEQRLEGPAFLKRLSRDIDAAHSLLSAAANASIIEYLWTGGAFFALAASFFFFCVLTDWKLINFALYVLALRGLYSLFPLLHGEQYIAFLRNLLPQTIPDAVLSALPALLAAALLAALGFALVLPRYSKRNYGGEFS